MRPRGPSSGPAARTVPAAAPAVGALVVCLAATGVVLASPRLLFGMHAPPVHLVLDSVDSCIAVLVAYLLFGRFRRDRSLRSLLLALGLLVLALANVAGGLVPHAGRFTLEVWFPQAVRVAGAALVALGALASRPVGRRAAYAVVAVVLGLLAATYLLLSVLRGSLPVALTTTPVSAASPTITGHPVLLAGHLLGAGCFLVAAIAFTADAGRRHDEMLRWFGPACVLGTFSRVHYTLFPSIYSGWIYTGDALRTGCYLLLLVGAAREIGRYWQAQPRLAVSADRRRVARELHDGVIQELVLIRSSAPAIADASLRARIDDAAGRGLEEARAAVEALDHGEEEPLSLQLHRAARQLTERYGARVVVDLDVTVQVSREQAHALLRITREAVANAVRHGGAGSVGIGLLRDRDRWSLVVHDDGRGFDPDAVVADGYGLVSMRDRAAGLPGECTIRSAEGRGTTVTVTW